MFLFIFPYVDFVESEFLALRVKIRQRAVNHCMSHVRKLLSTIYENADLIVERLQSRQSVESLSKEPHFTVKLSWHLLLDSVPAVILKC